MALKISIRRSIAKDSASATTHVASPIFDKGYIHQKEPPSGIQQDLKLTLDEFYLFDSNMEVQKVLSEETTTNCVKIEAACKAMRTRHSSSPACYSLCLTLNEELDKMIDLPRMIKEKSFYLRFWPSEYMSNFFKYKHKIFYAYQSGYKSHPYRAYGGLTEWLYVISGSIVVTIIKPTKINLSKFSALTEHEILDPESNTSQSFHLCEGEFFVIPIGFISTKKAVRTTFVLGGELLHQDNLIAQLEAFDDDVIRCEDSFNLSRQIIDAEIRYIYWFFAIHHLKSFQTSKHLSNSAVECLKSHLENWRIKSVKLIKANEPYLKPSLYVPPGIRVDKIVKDIQYRSCQIKRRSLKGSKDPVDVSP
jgi:hypothetical protein